MDLFELIILTSLLCVGIWRILQPGMIFSKLGDYLLTLKPRTVYKPLFSCVYCMSSFYSIVLYSLFMEYSISSIYELPIMMIAVCGLNGLVYNLNNLDD